VRLVHGGVAVRELTPVVSPLEAAFLALTEQPDEQPDEQPGEQPDGQPDEQPGEQEESDR
jgi:ABC-2 type transport system ATP-binding protein